MFRWHIKSINFRILYHCWYHIISFRNSFRWSNNFKITFPFPRFQKMFFPIWSEHFRVLSSWQLPLTANGSSTPISIAHDLLIYIICNGNLLGFIFPWKLLFEIITTFGRESLFHFFHEPLLTSFGQHTPILEVGVIIFRSWWFVDFWNSENIETVVLIITLEKVIQQFHFFRESK